MDVGARAGVLRSFAALPDPRMKRTRKHELLARIAIAICGVICGADGWTQIAAFGRAKNKIGHANGGSGSRRGVVGPPRPKPDDRGVGAAARRSQLAALQWSPRGRLLGLGITV